MIPEALLVVALHVTPERGERPKRTPAVGQNRWHDSGDIRVWKGVPRSARDVWLCIRRHESIEAGHYRAVNGAGSSATGAGQWLLGTWSGIKQWVKVDGKFVARPYRQAKDAPPWVQDAAFVHVWRHDGLSMWHGTWCPGT